MNMDFNKETALCEAVLFLESEPVTVKGLSNKAQLAEDVVEKCIENLKEKYSSEDSGIELAMITGGWALVPKKEYWAVLKGITDYPACFFSIFVTRLVSCGIIYLL